MTCLNFNSYGNLPGARSPSVARDKIYRGIHEAMNSLRGIKLGLGGVNVHGKLIEKDTLYETLVNKAGIAARNRDKAFGRVLRALHEKVGNGKIEAELLEEIGLIPERVNLFIVGGLRHEVQREMVLEGGAERKTDEVGCISPITFWNRTVIT